MYKAAKNRGNRFIPRNRSETNISIGDGSWLDANVVITGNVRIGRHCVIGANPVVTKNIPDYCVAVGIPRKVIKKYDFENHTWEKV